MNHYRGLFPIGNTFMQKQNKLQKLDQLLSNPMWMPIILTIGFVGWILHIYYITIPLLCIYSGLLLIFSEDIKNVYTIALSAQFFINEVKGMTDFVVLGIGILFFVMGLIYYLIKQLAIKKVKCRKGKMFTPFVCALVAYLIGGMFGYFNILNALIITAMTCATYFLYWVAINFTHNLKSYLNYFFICLGIVLAVQLITSYAFVDENFSSAILSKNVIYIGLQNINTASLYLVLAMLSTLQLALKHKLDYLIVLASTFFALCVYFTYCRICLFACVIAFIVFVVYIFVKSKNKSIFLFIAVIGCFSIEIMCLFKWDTIYRLLQYYLNTGFSANGRDELWSWCIEKFLNNPVFGIGFTSIEPVPTIVSNHVVLAHNTLLQYLTSCGIVGTLIISYYYYSRWKVAFTKYNEFKFVNSISLFAIALVSLIDQEPTMDVFAIIVITLLVSLAELDTDEILAKETAQNNTNHSTIEDNTNNQLATIETNTSPTTPNTTKTPKAKSNKKSTTHNK